MTSETPRTAKQVQLTPIRRFSEIAGMFACFVDLEYKAFTRNTLVQFGVCHSAERQPESVLQESIDKSRYGMFRFNVLGPEGTVEIYFTLFSRHKVLFCLIPRLESALSGIVREENDGTARPSACVNKP